MGDGSAASLIVVAFLSRLRFSRLGLCGASERPGTIWIPGRIIGRGHRRPRLHRANNLSPHYWALDIPGVWGRSPIGTKITFRTDN